jgi:hypothetical protein
MELTLSHTSGAENSAVYLGLWKSCGAYVLFFFHRSYCINI